jgi:hypothetical protein
MWRFIRFYKARLKRVTRNEKSEELQMVRNRMSPNVWFVQEGITLHAK